MTVKVETILKKIADLKKIDLSSNNVAFGRINDGQTQYHDKIMQARKDLSNFSRDLTKAEKDYVDNAEKEELQKLFNKMIKKNGGNASKALAEIKKSINQSVENEPKKHEAHAENYNNFHDNNLGQNGNQNNTFAQHNFA